MPDSDANGHGAGMSRLSNRYGRCPKCELIVPASSDQTEAGGAQMTPAGAMQCGLCAHSVEAAELRWLDLRYRCPDCEAVIRVPDDAAIVACPGCDSYFFNPTNPPDVQQRADAVLAERARIAQLIADLDRRLAEAQAHFDAMRQAPSSASWREWETCGKRTEALYGQFGTCVLPAGHTVPCTPFTTPGRSQGPSHEPVRVPDEWIDRSRPLPEMFTDVFTQAVRSVTSPREQRIIELRYGLDGKPGRTFRQIGEDLERSQSRVRDLLWQAWSKVQRVARWPDPERPMEHRTCRIVVHVATEVLGNPHDAHTPARVRAFVDQAFPNVRPQVSARLVVQLSDVDIYLLTGGREEALYRAIAAAHGA